ncbi:hypothetical protein OESDEN_24112, partial [Oesophagostomum dentatum]
SWSYAIDLDKAISTDKFRCIKTQGHSAVFISWSYTEMFMTPNPRSTKSGKDQFMDLYRGLQTSGIDVNRIFVQVSSPRKWPENARENQAFLKDIIKAANQKHIKVGVYTNHYDWREIMDGAKIDIPYLWYWNTNGDGPQGETQKNFNDLVTFGKFEEISAKQFAKNVKVCGVSVNR